MAGTTGTMSQLRRALSIPIASMRPEDRRRLWRTVLAAALFSLSALAFGTGVACLFL